MAIASPYNQYETVKVLTGSPLEHVILLYRRSINLLDEALEHLDNNEDLLFTENVKKTYTIIEYLLSILDMENGGEIARNLAQLYDYSLFTLTKSNIGKDRAGIEDVKEILSGLLGAWESIRK